MRKAFHEFTPKEQEIASTILECCQQWDHCVLRTLDEYLVASMMCDHGLIIYHPTRAGVVRYA